MTDDEVGLCPVCDKALHIERGLRTDGKPYTSDPYCRDIECDGYRLVYGVKALRKLQRNAALAKAGERLRDDAVPATPTPAWLQKAFDAFDAERKRWDDAE